MLQYLLNAHINSSGFQQLFYKYYILFQMNYVIMLLVWFMLDLIKSMVSMVTLLLVKSSVVNDLML